MILVGMPHAITADMAIKSFRDLDVWRLGMDLVDVVYDVSEGFPRHEWFGLRSQIRRAAVAIPSHVAEGSRQRTTPALIHYVTLAKCSNAELDTPSRILPAADARESSFHLLRHVREYVCLVQRPERSVNDRCAHRCVERQILPLLLWLSVQDGGKGDAEKAAEKQACLHHAGNS